MKSDNCEGRFSNVCETNPLKNDKYQKLERWSTSNMIEHILFYACTKCSAFNPKSAIPIIFYTNLLGYNDVLFQSILQIWSILIGFRDTNDFANLGIVNMSSNSPAAAIADIP